jgi:hypothetical protein
MIRSLSQEAPVAEMRRFMHAAPDETGRRLDGQLLDDLLTSSPEQAVACTAFAAAAYAEVNPYRWASPTEAIAFGALVSRFRPLPLIATARKESIEAILRRAIPELDEILDLQAHTVHWVKLVD